MKLLVQLGMDYHLGQLPHFLHHYHSLGVDGFLIGLHGRRIAEARRMLADYPVEIIADYGVGDFRAVCTPYWKANLNLFRRQRVRRDEWCLSGLNVHHFRWDDLAAAKYRDRRIARGDELGSGRVPDLRGVFLVDPPFPAAHGAEGLPPPPAMAASALPASGDEAARGPLQRAARLDREHPAVSCFCLTYARPEVLEEAIYSFLRQDYTGPKELIVLNDYGDQILTFDHPEVQVINVPRRFRTVGEKMNAAVALASHDLLFVWDDDDIYLPHRLSLSVANFDPVKGFFKANHAWRWDDGRLSGPMKNVLHAGSCWKRSLFDAVRGYPAEGTGYDWLFEQRLESRFPGSTAAHRVAPEEIYYLYRWGGTGSYHMSGFGGLKIGQNVGQAQVEAFVRNRADRGEIPRGRVPLHPCWRADYPRLASSYISTLAASASPE